jgi:hypothetical protein
MDQEIEWLSDFGLKGNCLIQFYLPSFLVGLLSESPAPLLSYSLSSLAPSF